MQPLGDVEVGSFQAPRLAVLSAAGVMRCDLHAGCEGCAASAAVGGQPNQQSIPLNSIVFASSLLRSQLETQWRLYYDHKML